MSGAFGVFFTVLTEFDRKISSSSEMPPRCTSDRSGERKVQGNQRPVERSTGQTRRAAAAEG